MRMFTARGDQGETDLLGARVEKDDPRVDLLGALDEATSSIGLGRAHATLAGTSDLLVTTQRDLYQVMAELAFVRESGTAAFHMEAARTEWLETEIESIAATVTLPREFVLPGDSVPGAALDVARTVVRRAERLAVALARSGEIGNSEILRYINRLSSLLFMLARAEDVASTGTVHVARDDA